MATEMYESEMALKRILHNAQKREKRKLYNYYNLLLYLQKFNKMELDNLSEREQIIFNTCQGYVKEELTDDLKEEYLSLNTKEPLENLFLYGYEYKKEKEGLKLAPRDPIEASAKKLTPNLKQYLSDCLHKAIGNQL